MTTDEQMTARFSIAMTPSELKALDDWAWERRIRSRSEAVRHLVQLGMEASKTRDAKPDRPEPGGE